jgi:hypothetical protein
MANNKAGEHTFGERLFAVVFVFILIPIFLYLIFFSGGEHSQKQYIPDKVDLNVQAQEFVRQALKSPSTAEFPALPSQTSTDGGGLYRVVSYVDSQNSFGGMIRSDWSVTMRLVGEKWILEKMAIDNKIIYDAGSSN